MSLDDKLSPAEILRRYAAGDRDFQDLDIEECLIDTQGFRDATLTGADFSRSFIFADFRRANLRFCRFAITQLTFCNFDGADVRGCDFSDAALDFVGFTGAQVTGANFAGSSNQGVVLGPGEIPWSAKDR